MSNEITLDNGIDYESLKSLERCYSSFYNIEELALRGNTVALAVYVDLKNGLLNSNLNEKQLHYMYCLMHRYTRVELACKFGITFTGVSSNIDAALKKIQRYLKK